MKMPASGETVKAEFVAATYGSLSAVDSLSTDGVVDGPTR